MAAIVAWCTVPAAFALVSALFSSRSVSSAATPDGGAV